MIEVNLTVLVYKLFHKDFSLIIRVKFNGNATIFILYIHQFGRDSRWVALVILIISYPILLGAK